MEKDGRKEIRTTAADRAKLEWLAENMRLNDSEVIREAVDLLFRYKHAEAIKFDGSVASR